MLIACPYCGPRDVAEFTYQGDGNRTRPDPASTDLGAWNEYIFDRVNVAGDHNEIWQHSGGCRSHLFVVRNTLTHKVASVRLVREAPRSVPPTRSIPETVQTALAEQALTAAHRQSKAKSVSRNLPKTVSKSAKAPPRAAANPTRKPGGAK